MFDGGEGMAEEGSFSEPTKKKQGWEEGYKHDPAKNGKAVEY
jgi:hypothetical protein